MNATTRRTLFLPPLAALVATTLCACPVAARDGGALGGDARTAFAHPGEIPAAADRYSRADAADPAT